jgi:hypothetical protein
MDRKARGDSRGRQGARRGGRSTSVPAGGGAARGAWALLEAGHRPGAEQMATLQRRIGNDAVGRLLQSDSTSGQPPTAVAQRAPSLGAPVAPSAEQVAVAGVYDGWTGLLRIFDRLKMIGRATLNGTAAATGGKDSKKLAKARDRFESAVALLGDQLLDPYQEVVVAKDAVDRGSSTAAAAAAKVPAMHAALNGALTEVVRGCMDAAKQAHALGQADNADEFTDLARHAQQAGGRLPQTSGSEKPATPHKERLATATAYADTANNAGPGVLGGAIGGGEAIFGSISAASSGFGGVFGGLGVLFGTIGVVMGIKAAVLGSGSESELKALDGSLSSDKLRDAAVYAANKKRKKKLGGGMSASAGGIAIVAGGFGIAAAVLASIATLGIAAAVFGLVAAGIGLAFVIGKWRHRVAKRSAYARGLAEELIAIAKDRSDPAAQARAVDELDERGFLVTALGDKAEEARQLPALVASLEKDGRSRRADIAAAIYRGLSSDDVAEQIDAERIVEALHLKPAKIRQLEPAAARSAIAGKMASW